MASSTSSLSPPSLFVSLPSKEKSNHTRLCRLLVEIGRKVFQDVFDRIHHPSHLTTVLWSTPVRTTLNNLKGRGILYQNQWDILFPPSGGSKSQDFDITLLFLLLRNICNLVPPLTGWNNPPSASDHSRAADIVRIKLYRNKLHAHIVDTRITDAVFNSLWNDIQTALLRLSGSKSAIGQSIQCLLHENLDPESEHCVKVLLHAWEEGEERILDAIRQSHDSIEKKSTLTIKGTFRLVTAGGVVVAWAAGSGYMLRRYINEPDSLLVLVNGAIIPSMFATGAFVRQILEGSFKLLTVIHSLSALDGIYKSYKSGEMKRKLENVLVNDEMRSLAPDDAEDVDILLEISEDNYKSTRDSLLEACIQEYVGACTNSSSSDEETISEHLQNIGVRLQDNEKPTQTIVYQPGKLEWSIVKNLLSNTSSVSIDNGMITLKMYNPLHRITHVLTNAGTEGGTNLDVEDIQGRTPLVLAVKAKQYGLAVRLVESGANIKKRLEDWETHLMHAVGENNEELVNALLNAGADVNEIVPSKTAYSEIIYSRTALICAMESKSKQLVDIIINAGAEVIQSDQLNTQLRCAIEMANETLVSMLIAAGADVNRRDGSGNTPLLYAIKAKQTNVVKVLVNAGADVNRRDGSKRTPLIQAIEITDEEVVDVLLMAGADANKPCTWKSPLIFAFEKRSEVIADKLLKAGADINLKDPDTKTTLLIHAVQRSDNEIVARLVKCGADVNASDPNQMTALMHAIEKSNQELVEILVHASANVNVRDMYGETVLIYALKTNNKNIVDVIINAGADVNRPSSNLKTPLRYAIEENNEELVAMLIEAKAEVNKSFNWKTPLLTAIELKNAKVVKMLIKGGADIHIKDNNGTTAFQYAKKRSSKEVVEILNLAGAKDLKATGKKIESRHTSKVLQKEETLKTTKGIKEKDPQLQAALMKAIEQSNLKDVKTILEARADVNSRRIQGKTPLMYSVERSSQEIVNELLKYGADVHAKDSNNNTVLMYAIDRSNKDILRTLIDAGANVNEIVGNGDTPLVYAIRRFNQKIVEMLLDSGAAVNSKSREGKTALMHSIEKSRVVKRLIDTGADVNVCDSKGKTALMYAAEKSSKAVVQLLLDVGADVSARDSFGRTVLMFAAQTYGRDVVDLLLDAGAELTEKDKKGKTALMYSAESGQVEIVECLLEAGADADATDVDGNTALMHAVKQDDIFRCGFDRVYLHDLEMTIYNSKRVTEVLLEYGADVDIKDNRGRTALNHCQIILEELSKTCYDEIDSVHMVKSIYGRVWTVAESLVQVGFD